LYEKEGLGVKKIHYIDNQDCIGETDTQLIFVAVVINCVLEITSVLTFNQITDM